MTMKAENIKSHFTPQSSKDSKRRNVIDLETLRLVKEAMASGISKAQFREFIEQKKGTKIP